MKIRRVMILLLFLCFGFIVSNETISAAKKLEKKEPAALYVQKGKTYKLSKILSDIKDPTEDVSVKDFLKGKKVKWSVNKKQIKLTKNTIKVKKQGNFKLTGKTLKYKYVIVLKSVPERWSAIPKGITKISIMKNGKTVEVDDSNKVNAFCNLLNSADYRFGDTYTLVPPGWTYRIKLYYANGKEERSFVVGYSLGGGYYSKKWKEVENKISELYDTGKEL